MKILLAVDLQPEFADKDGKYEEILAFVRRARRDGGYDRVIATKCRNSSDSNFVRYNNWHKLINGTAELEFEADTVIEKLSYGLLDYSVLPKDARVDIVGYDTGACVLKIALDLFDRNYDFRVLCNYCYASSGLKHHKHGLWTLRNLMEKALE